MNTELFAIAPMTGRATWLFVVLPGDVPTSEGYSALVTPSDPNAFLAALRRLGRP